MDQFIDEMPVRAQRPISVREGTSIREETVSEKFGDSGFRSKSWSQSLREFLTWYNDYRHAHRVFRSPEGETVRAPLTNSHQPNYGDKYYARIKALERQITADYDDLYVAMLTLSGSSRNGNGGWRCPADHLRDVIDSFRPNEGRGVYHALYDSLRDYQWEYALVVEHHKTGYGHVHVAIFIDGKVDESDFHSAIDAHLRTCEIAHRDAHDYYSTDPSDRPISVRQVDSELDPDDYEQYDKVGNLGSYIGEYIGSYGGELFNRNLEELVFRASCWATGTQMVRFSTGANALIDRELDREEKEDAEPVVIPNPDFDPEIDASNKTDTKPFDVDGETWTLEGIGRVDADGETVYDLQRNGVQYQKIDGAEHLDPPNPQPPDQPFRRTSATSLREFNSETKS
ncbi:replication protein [Halobaculum rarum]|uniref:replication protein n=1 Tax=Halobaculum rarum TaxID=3075122 RepID=UPI0032AF652A